MSGGVLLLVTLDSVCGGKTTLTIQNPAERWRPSRTTTSSAEQTRPAVPMLLSDCCFASLPACALHAEQLDYPDV
ncbi:hypothetical protein EYF80_034789 [Liparis tanakae]|uniref:Secreted protein n=1 Tax=Liparis tanakae TaxID=230148 RepID=A0A4Z2GQL6_9TELE|nr:hypothetical protein EYF80_034789 [Liparis tanakae]